MIVYRKIKVHHAMLAFTLTNNTSVLEGVGQKNIKTLKPEAGLNNI
jgi:hypothetical protein